MRTVLGLDRIGEYDRLFRQVFEGDGFPASQFVVLRHGRVVDGT